ncbi:MAG: hypothetical protein AVDCRST_MAG15-3391, partial [uncultured Rubellimicrobium sp.]
APPPVRGRDRTRSRRRDPRLHRARGSAGGPAQGPGRGTEGGLRRSQGPRLRRQDPQEDHLDAQARQGRPRRGGGHPRTLQAGPRHGL